MKSCHTLIVSTETRWGGRGERSNPANTGQIMRKQGLKNYYTLRDASAYNFLVGRQHGSWQFGLNGVLIVCKSFFTCHSGTLLKKKNQFLFTQVTCSYLSFRLHCVSKDLRSVWLSRNAAVLKMHTWFVTWKKQHKHMLY